MFSTRMQLLRDFGGCIHALTRAGGSWNSHHSELRRESQWPWVSPRDHVLCLEEDGGIFICSTQTKDKLVMQAGDTQKSPRLMVTPSR